MTMGSDSEEGSDNGGASRGTTPRGLRPFAKVAWYLRDWEWSSKVPQFFLLFLLFVFPIQYLFFFFSFLVQDELGQSEDEPPAVLSIKREYCGDMFWLICESIDDARKLTRHIPEAQKMLEPSSGFYDPYVFDLS